ncbi:MAG: hypothetical protein AAGB31_01520 [Bdellovibrio sp.]
MMKKIVVFLACLGLAFQMTSCTSKDSQSDSEMASDFDSADLEKLDNDEALELTRDEALSSDQLPEDALGETTSNVADTSHDVPAPTDMAATSEPMPSDPFADSHSTTTTDSSTTIVDSGVSSEPESSSMIESSPRTGTASFSEPVKQNVPLQKVPSAPWKVGKTWFNTVYFARPGDSLASISRMIYGNEGKVAELKKGNPSFKSRSVKPGEKVYYSSPHRADDSSRMITYYEDNGIAPEVYVAKSGDNIRKISKNLLGYDNAWKEVWSSNSVDSKGAISEGTELRYWRGGAIAAAPPAPSQEIAAGGMMEDHSLPPPPTGPAHDEMPAVPPQQAQADFPPPPPMPEQEMDMPPPPPPPGMDMAQDHMAPPPPPAEVINPPALPPPQMAEESAPEMDNDTTMALAVVGLGAAGLAALIVIRKKRKQRELEQQAMDNTHVGT